MKKGMFLFLLLIGFISTTSYSMVHNNTLNDSITKSKSKTAEKWKKQLEHAKKHTSKIKSTDRAVKYIGYKYIGTIKKNSEIPTIIEQMLSSGSAFAMGSDIYSIYQCINMLGSREFVDDLKRTLRDSIKVGMKLLELKWSYDNETYHSTAIVSNDGIIYDNIGHFTQIPNKNSDKDKNKPPKQSNTNIKTFSKHLSGKNIYENIVWELAIICKSAFNDYGVLYDIYYDVKADFKIGYSCAGSIKTVGGKIDRSSHHEFKWEYSYGANTPSAVGLNGALLNRIPAGNGKSANGTETHSL